MDQVTMYTTAVCPFCIRAKQLLQQRGVENITEIRVDLDPQAHVGGCDELVALDRQGDLVTLLASK